MADIKIYIRETGEIFNEQSGHPNDKDVLTKERQQEMLAMLFPERFYEVGMIVSEGDNAVFMPDIVEGKEVEEEIIVNTKFGTKTKKKVKRNKKFIKANKLNEINSFQRQRS